MLSLLRRGIQFNRVVQETREMFRVQMEKTPYTLRDKLKNIIRHIPLIAHVLTINLFATYQHVSYIVPMSPSCHFFVNFVDRNRKTGFISNEKLV